MNSTSEWNSLKKNFKKRRNRSDFLLMVFLFVLHSTKTVKDFRAARCPRWFSAVDLFQSLRLIWEAYYCATTRRYWWEPVDYIDNNICQSEFKKSAQGQFFGHPVSLMFFSLSLDCMSVDSRWKWNRHPSSVTIDCDCYYYQLWELAHKMEQTKQTTR